MAAEALEQSVLESKDKDQLLAIAKALGLKASARTKKSDIIGQILETTGAVAAPSNGDAPAANGATLPGMNGSGVGGDANGGPRRAGRPRRDRRGDAAEPW